MRHSEIRVMLGSRPALNQFWKQPLKWVVWIQADSRGLNDCLELGERRIGACGVGRIVQGGCDDMQSWQIAAFTSPRISDAPGNREEGRGRSPTLTWLEHFAADPRSQLRAAERVRSVAMPYWTGHWTGLDWTLGVAQAAWRGVKSVEDD